MKIVHMITRLILGGAQENTVLTCEGLHRRGHDVTLITGPPLGPEGELLGRARTGGYEVIVVNESVREISPGRDRRVYRAYKDLLADLRPDVVHTHSSKAGILGRRAAAKLNAGPLAARPMKIVHTIHGLPFHRYESWWKNRLYIGLEKRAARQSDAILCVADAMSRQALAAGVGTPEQYATVYSGMETQRFVDRPDDAEAFRASLNLPADAVLITQVARLAEMKGHFDIIKAAVTLADPRLHFCFVGDGYLREEIKDEIYDMRLDPNFHLTGLLPPSKIPAVMHASDILIHCSYREGLARTLVQAMLAGLPVVSYDVDGAPEVVNAETGMLVPPGDVDGLAAAVRVLVDSPDLRQTLGRHGRTLCRERFDHETMVADIEAAYEGLMASGSASSTDT
ncbi:MAG: glycosyltransferase [Planctomycetes bacterium]|jgi:glycosyltransferase involved in cell wall biosynthesis|nr:glycosyltransferase family 4 protein [Phycisphaerae bacterium]NBB96507.1 glycosyltransferase [Planctomycetota bacterium]